MRSAYLPGAMGSLNATVSGSLLSRKQVSVVPLRPGPVSTMFLSFLEILIIPVRTASLFNMRRMIAHPGPDVSVSVRNLASLSSGFWRIELTHDGGGYLLDYLRLPGRQVVAPTTRRGLSIELAFPLHILGDSLPRLLLHRPGQFLVLGFYPQSSVQSLHGFKCFGPELLVEDQRLGTRVGVVGVSGPLHVP